MQIQIPDFPAVLPPRLGEVHVWQIQIPRLIPQLAELFTFLSVDEVRRAQRFHFQKDREQFGVVRGILRFTLAKYLKANPTDIRFQYNDHGKPYLPAEIGHKRIQFNVSHSSEMALIAITLKYEVGIDIERIRPDLAELKIARRFFAPEEYFKLQALPESEQKEAFFNCWTRKEAFIKAKGGGLSIPLDQFCVTFTHHEPAALISVKHNPEAVASWSICDLPVNPDYKAALAIFTKNCQLKFFRIPASER